MQDQTEKRVLWISNYGYPNSYCDVTRTLLNAFLEKYPDAFEFYLYCIGRTQPQNFEAIVSSEIPIPPERIFYPILFDKEITTPEDQEFMKHLILGLPGLGELKQRIDPDITISLNDIGPFLLQKKFADTVGLDIIPYVPFDKDRVSADIGLSETNIPRALTPSEHSQREYQRILPGCQVDVLPHIVDSDAYFPLSEEVRADLKKKWLPQIDMDGDPPPFVVVAVNRNNVRKRMDLLVQAFARFSAGKKNVWLLVKTDPLDHQEKFSSIWAPQYDLDRLFAGLDNVAVVTRQVSNHELNEIYNCADVGLSTSSGEGFGLTACEMSLCEVPQLVPHNTSSPYLFGDSYPGLIDCTPTPAAVARSFLSAEAIEKDVICIMKIYIHPDGGEQMVSGGPLAITEQAASVLLSTDEEVIDRHRQAMPVFGDVFGLLLYLKEAVPAMPRVQVLLNTNRKLIQRLDFAALFDTAWPQRKVYRVDPAYLSSYISQDDVTGLVQVDSAVALLEACYRERDRWHAVGKECRARMLEKFSREAVVEKMFALLSSETHGLIA